MKFATKIPIFILVCAFCGCAHEKYTTDSRHPEIVVNERAEVLWRGKVVEPEDIPSLLEDSDFSRDETVYIRVPEKFEDQPMRVSYYVMGLLAKKGYRRPMLQKERKAYSEAGKLPERPLQNQVIRRSAPSIRYKTN